MTAVIPAEGTILDRILDAACATSHGGLNRHAYGKFHAAQMKTPWGRCSQRRLALVEGADVLASAERYDLLGVFDGRAVRVCGIGSVFTEPAHRSRVAESPRHGAPMTMVRGGEERDLAAVVAMGRVRAEQFRFHLDRDIAFLQYAITKKRLLAGLGPANARQLHFFIAEEGMTAAAYVIVSGVGNMWTLEECGDRDPSGARVGALLQALGRGGRRG